MFPFDKSFVHIFITGLLFYFSECITTSSDDQMVYYQNLINEEIQKAAMYQQPTRNVEFEKGSESKTILDYGTFDFIIVGAGSSGSVLARRLAEIADLNVLVLEAGGEATDFSDIPALLLHLQFSDMNWGYYSKPQDTCCLGMKNKQCNAARGKVIGGCSTINALMYVRGNKHDFIRWAELGNPKWSYDKVLPYFKKSEDSHVEGDPGFHGEGGLWNVEYAHPPSNTFWNYLEANEQMKRKYTDYNGRSQIGVSKTQVNTKDGRRQSLGKAFLQDARTWKNLNVTTKALAVKIVFEKKTARGIVFIKNNKKYLAKASKEVIVSAGAFNTPQLLMLSGIGPRKHLEDMKIPVVEDLPAVGQNLYDHPNLYTLNFHTNFTFNLTMEDLVGQYLKGEGPLANPANAEAVGFIHTKSAPPGVPSLEYIFFPSPTISPQLASRVFNYNEELVSNYLAKMTPQNDITLYLMLLHPKSKGSVTLQSNNPIDFPVIDYNLFSDAKNQDIETYIEGIEFIMELVQQDGFKKINATFIDLPICKEFDRFSKAYWECVVRHTAFTIYHPSSTTRMGLGKKHSVVNEDLKVHGLKGLRVVDAGVIPSTTSGHLNAVAVMIAEKISDEIKRDYHHI